MSSKELSVLVTEGTASSTQLTGMVKAVVTGLCVGRAWYVQAVLISAWLLPTDCRF